MSTAVLAPPAPSPPPSVVDQKTTKRGKKKGKGRLEDNTGAFVEGPREKTKAKAKKRIEGQGLDEVQSDSPPPEGEEIDAIAQSELSSNNDSEEDEASKQARRAARPKDYYQKRDLADQRQAAATANEGFSNYTKAQADRKAPEKRPALVEKEWRGLYPILRMQWKKGGRPEVTGPRAEIYKQANRKIKDYCDSVLNVDIEFNTKANALYLVQLEKLEADLAGKSESFKMLRRKQLLVQCAKTVGQPSREELLQKWIFPKDELCGQIYAVEKGLSELDNMPSEAAYRRQISDYDSLVATEADPQKSTALIVKKEKAETRLKDRKIKTEKLLQTALILLQNLERRGIPAAAVMDTRIDSIFRGFLSQSGENVQLFQALKAEMNRPTLEQLDEWETAAKPMCDFLACVNDDAMTTKQSIGKARSLVKNLARIDKKIESLAEAEGDSNRLPMSIVQEIMQNFEQSQPEQVQQNTASLLDQLRRQEPALGLVRAVEVGEPLDGLKAESESVAKPATASEAAANVTAQASTNAVAEAVLGDTGPTVRKAGAAVISPGANLSEDFLRDVDITTFRLGENVTEVFQYENGMTEYGPLVATRVSISDSALHNRYCVNSGLDDEKWTYHKIFRGSRLGPGGAEKLADQKVAKFDAKQRKKDIKGSHPIIKYGPVVVMPRAEGYVRTGKTQRRLDSYIFVRYKGLPEPDFLSRSEWTQLVGVRGEKYFLEQEIEYGTRQVYFEACKVQKRHPKTREPLTADDLRETPWLFPGNERGSSFAPCSVNGADQDDNVDFLAGATADTGAPLPDIPVPGKV